MRPVLSLTELPYSAEGWPVLLSYTRPASRFPLEQAQADRYSTRPMTKWIASIASAGSALTLFQVGVHIPAAVLRTVEGGGFDADAESLSGDFRNAIGECQGELARGGWQGPTEESPGE